MKRGVKPERHGRKGKELAKARQRGHQGSRHIQRCTEPMSNAQSFQFPVIIKLLLHYRPTDQATTIHPASPPALLEAQANDFWTTDTHHLLDFDEGCHQIDCSGYMDRMVVPSSSIRLRTHIQTVSVASGKTGSDLQARDLFCVSGLRGPDSIAIEVSWRISVRLGSRRKEQ